MFRSMIFAGLAGLLSSAAQAQPSLAVAVSGPGWSLTVAQPVVMMAPPVMMVAQPVGPVRVVPGWVLPGNGVYAPAPRWMPPPHWRHVHRREWREEHDWRRGEERGRGGHRSRWDN